MKTKLLIGALALFSSVLFSQSVPMALEDWRTTQGTQNFYYKNVTKTDANGNVIVAGATMNGGTTDILVAKYNASGNLQWIQQYAGTAPNGVDFAAGMYVTDFYIYLTGAVTNNSVTPETDCFTMKLNTSDGTIVWNTVYSGAAGSLDAGKDVIIDGSGNVYVTGASYNASYNSDYLFLKYNSSGVQQWANTWDYLGADDAGYKVAISGANLNITGAVTTATPNIYTASALKVAQSNGAITAINTLTTVTTTSVDVVCDMVATAGDIYISGSNNVSGQGTNMYVQKINLATFTTSWIYTYNGASNGDDNAKAIDVDASGNIYVTGYSTSSTLGRELILIKLNSSGSNLWTQTSGFSGNDEAMDLVLDNSGNPYITGYKSKSNVDKSYYTAKYNTSGTKVWEVTLDGKDDLNDYATNITLDSLQNVVITGQSEQSSGSFEFVTARYVQKDIIVPTDINNEDPSELYWYYGNEGQIRDLNDSIAHDVVYYTHHTSPNFYVSKEDLSYVFAKGDTVATSTDTIQRVKFVLKNANGKTKAYSLEQQDFSISYLLGNADYKAIKGNRKLVIPDIYSNIDLLLSSNGNGLKYYYIVKPGGDPRDIQLEFDGLASYNIDGTTNEFSITTNCGSISFPRPTAYQLTTSNNTVAVTGWTPDWQTNGGSNKLKFNTGVYTSSLTLVIMVDRAPMVPLTPTADNMLWNTYQGGNLDDYMKDLKLDRKGNIYTLAETWSSNFYMNPTNQLGAPPAVNKQAVTLMKYRKAGERKSQVYISASGTAGCGPVAIAITNDSCVVIGGFTGGTLSSPSGGNPSGALSLTSGISWIMKLNNVLTGVQWMTRYPGEIQDIDSKLNGDLYMTVSAPKTGVLIYPQSGALNIDASMITNPYSQLVQKFNSNGVPLWASYIGVKGISNYYGYNRIKVDTTNNEVYMFGANGGMEDWIGYNHYGTWLQNTATGFDGYIKKFNSSDSMKVSTFIGGNKSDQLTDVAFLANGDIAFSGSTNSTDTVNIIKNPLDGSYISKKYDNSKSKGWVIKFAHNFNWKYGTLYGDSLKSTSFSSISTDPVYNTMLLAGYTEGMPNVSVGGYYNKGSDASGDAAFVTFDESHNVTWATSMGVQNLFGDQIVAAAYNPKNSNWDFVGASAGNANYPWRYFNGAYNQNSNAGPGYQECTTGRFYVNAPVVSVKEIKPLQGIDILLFPNPSNSYTNLYFKQGLNEKTKITLCNTIGQIVEVRSFDNIEANTTLHFNTSGLAEGLYFINIATEKSSYSVKFVNFK